MKARLCLGAVVASLAGCASAPPPPPLFVDSPTTTIAPPPADKAQVIFVEPINAIQGMFPTAVWEVNADNSKTLLAQIASHGKSVQLVTPGHHLFMANSGIAHFMPADVEAGKRYYVLMRFIYANGMQLRPIRATGPSDFSVANKDFDEWITITHPVDKTPAADAWIAKSAAYVDKAQAAGWADWQKKSPKERAELTLDKEDAIDR